MIEAEVQMSLFESEEEMAAAWLMGRYEDAKRCWRRDLTFKDWLDGKFTGWEGGTTFFGGEFDTYTFSSKGLELRGNGNALFFKREQIYRMFGIREGK